MGVCASYFSIIVKINKLNSLTQLYDCLATTKRNLYLCKQIKRYEYSLKYVGIRHKSSVF